jgi:hypothetical protein
MLTLATWLGPSIGALVALSVGGPILRRLLERRGERARLVLAIERLASDLAQQRSSGYPWQYPAWVDFYAGRRADAEGITSMPPSYDPPSA